MRGAALRRSLHVASAGILLLVPMVGWGPFPFVVAGGGAFAMAIEALRLRSATARDVFARHVPVFRRPESARPSGAAWLVLAYVVTAWFPPPVVVPAILVAAVADPAASLAGTVRPGRVSRAGKTLRGSGAFFLVAAAILLGLGVPWSSALGVGAVGTAVERWSGPIDDNLLVAPAVAAALLLLT